MSNPRPVVVDLTIQEARTVAAVLDLGAALAEITTDGPSVKDVQELRMRFVNGATIAEQQERPPLWVVK